MIDKGKRRILAVLFVLAMIGSFVVITNFDPLTLTLTKPCEVQSNPNEEL